MTNNADPNQSASEDAGQLTASKYDHDVLFVGIFFVGNIDPGKTAPTRSVTRVFLPHIWHQPFYWCTRHLSRNVRKRTLWHLHPRKTQESSLSTRRNFASLAIQNAPSQAKIPGKYAGWSKTSLGVHVQKYVSWRCCSYGKLYCFLCYRVAVWRRFVSLSMSWSSWHLRLFASFLSPSTRQQFPSTSWSSWH